MSSINWQTGERAQSGAMCACLAFGPHRARGRLPSPEGEWAGKELAGKTNNIAEQEEGTHNISVDSPGNNRSRGNVALNVYKKKLSASLDISRGPARVANGQRQLPGEEQEMSVGRNHP